jgi:lipopolysaccharide/colanic/teichoic acid biosynthesis glycosyltransferase
VVDRDPSATNALDLHDDERTPVRLVPVVDVHQRGAYERFVKPSIDRIAGVLLTVITAPIIMVAVSLIWWKIGRPAIFRQNRVGLHGNEFTVYKLRTMRDDRRRLAAVGYGGDDRRVNHKSPDDPRHTEIGRFLRKWSIDELPQFWNVARGDMSLIGPRPELGHIVAQYEPWQHRRHEVRPGLTGLWQVSARGDVPMHEATDIDLEYLDSVSLMTDVKIALRTPLAVLGSQKGH